MKIPTVPVCTKTKTRQGMTLIEVMLGAVILAILAVMASTAFFYPRLLVVNSGLEQSAIHAGIGKIERNLHSIDSTLDQFNTDGWDIDVTNVTSRIWTNPPETIIGTSGDTCNYLVISNSISFRDGKPPVEFITYRSREISSTER